MADDLCLIHLVANRGEKKRQKKKRSLPYMPRHESKAKAMTDLGMPLRERHAVANFYALVLLSIFTAGILDYCLEGLDEKRSAWRAKGQAVASSAGQLVSKARLASGVKWTNGWPTHTTLAPQAIDATLVALIEPTGYSPG